jgi:phytoene synthase
MSSRPRKPSAIAERQLDFDRLTALDQMPRSVRPAMGILWAVDMAMADVVSSTTQPLLGAVRLAWWRERLEDLDTGAPPPSEWRLEGAVKQLLPRGITGRELAGLEDGWLPLLEPFPWREPVAHALRVRGSLLFNIGARLLNGDPRDAEAAGSLWSLVDGARHCSDVHSRMYLLKEARASIDELPRERPPRRLRRLTGLAAMAAHDVLRNKPLDLPYEDPGRGIAALLHHMRGTLPRA